MNDIAELHTDFGVYVTHTVHFFIFNTLPKNFTQWNKISLHFIECNVWLIYRLLYVLRNNFFVHIPIPPAFEILGSRHCKKWQRILTSKNAWISSPVSYNSCWLTEWANCLRLWDLRFLRQCIWRQVFYGMWRQTVPQLWWTSSTCSVDGRQQVCNLLAEYVAS
jgi:hypothetical protein